MNPITQRTTRDGRSKRFCLAFQALNPKIEKSEACRPRQTKISKVQLLTNSDSDLKPISPQIVEEQHPYHKVKTSNALLTFAFPILMTFGIDVPFITSAQEITPAKAKRFGEITIPQEINPQHSRYSLSVEQL